MHMVTYGILINSKFSHLRIKHNVHHMSTCTESACIYALFKITDSFFTYQSFSINEFLALALFEGFHFLKFGNFVC